VDRCSAGLDIGCLVLGLVDAAADARLPRGDLVGPRCRFGQKRQLGSNVR